MRIGCKYRLYFVLQINEFPHEQQCTVIIKTYTSQGTYTTKNIFNSTIVVVQSQTQTRGCVCNLLSLSSVSTPHSKRAIFSMSQRGFLVD